MSHIFRYSVLEGMGANINTKALNITPESPLWKSNKKGIELISRFSSYMIKNRIKVPIGLEVFPFTRNAALTS